MASIEFGKSRKHETGSPILNSAWDFDSFSTMSSTFNFQSNKNDSDGRKVGLSIFSREREKTQNGLQLFFS